MKGNGRSKIHVANRAQLIDDAFALVRAEQLNIKIALKLASYLVSETEFEPWYTALNAFKHIVRMLKANNDKSTINILKVNYFYIGYVKRFPVSL